MSDAVITEYAGTRRDDTISRFYQYGNGGVRVLDGRKNLKRLYRFDPDADIMTERDPFTPDRILRRCVFDRMGMLEETFSYGSRPRRFRYEQGCQLITVREGGEFGQVGKTFTFEKNGISETGWGRNGEIERVFIFEPGNDTITERAGGWYGSVERTIIFKGINASLFHEPEAFLQFLMFTEWSDQDKEEVIQEQVAKIRGGKTAAPGRSPYAYTGERRNAGNPAVAGGREPVSRIPDMRNDAFSSRTNSGNLADVGIDFISEGDAPVKDNRRGLVSSSQRSAGISLEERFESARSERGQLSKGRSVEIPLAERFESARSERGQLSKGRSVEIPLEERFESSRGERGQLSKGRSVEIPLEERFESARSERGKLSKGRSVEIPYSERKAGRDL